MNITKLLTTLLYNHQMEMENSFKYLDIVEILMLGEEYGASFSYKDEVALKKRYKEEKFFNYGFFPEDFLEGFLERNDQMMKVELPSGKLIGEYTSPKGSKIILLPRPELSLAWKSKWRRFYSGAIFPIYYYFLQLFLFLCCLGFSFLI